MSVTTVPNSSLLGDDNIDELRTRGFIAMDKAKIKLPVDMVTYIRYLENDFLRRKQDRATMGLTELWGLRTKYDNSPQS